MVKSRKLQFRVTEEEDVLIQEVAKDLGRSVSNYSRRVVLADVKKVKPK